MTDRGRADVKIYGRGMSVDLDVRPGLPVPTPEKPLARALGKKRWLTGRRSGRCASPEDKYMLCSAAAEVVTARAKIHRMSLRVYESKHDFLYTIFNPYLKSQIKQVRAWLHRGVDMRGRGGE